MRFAFLVVLIAAVLVAVVWYEPPAEPGAPTESAPVEESATPTQNTARPVTQAPSGQAGLAGLVAVRALPESLEPPAVAPSHSYLLDPEIAMSDWQDRLQREMREAPAEDVARHRKDGNAGDSESAFWMYLFYNYCRHQPRALWQLDASLRRLQEHVDRYEERGSDEMIRSLSNRPEQLENGYRLCSLIPPSEDVVVEALGWLELAADLGHMGAQRLYHYAGRQLLVGGWLSSLAFQEPHRIGEFQNRADAYARALLDTGHPQAYLLLARMLHMGDVYERDRILAYAYALAVKNEFGTIMQHEAQRRMDWIGPSLHPTKIAEAERLARDLVRRHGE